MEAPHPTAGWEQVGERFYRKTQLYTAIFDQDLDLDNHIVVGAPYSGAIGEISLHFPHPAVCELSPTVPCIYVRQAEAAYGIWLVRWLTGASRAPRTSRLSHLLCPLSIVPGSEPLKSVSKLA